MTTTTGRGAGRVASGRQEAGVPELKLSPPPLPPGLVRRARLLDRLQSSGSWLITIYASAGYGKTLLTRQWMEREDRPMAWLTLDRTDDDAAHLLSDMSGALRRAGLLPPGAMRFSSSAAISHGVPRLLSALETAQRPGILVLDNFDAVRTGAAIDTIGALVHQAAGRLITVLIARSEGRLPTAALRSLGTTLELSASDLAFDREEAAELFRLNGIEIGDELGVVMDRTEGWPVGVYLTALASKVGSPGAAPLSVRGDDRYIAEYLRQEILSHLSGPQISFLIRTSILDQLSGPLCDHVLDTSGSGRTLQALERSNLLISRLDRSGEWHRYHHLLQDLLRAELQLSEPGEVPVLHARAAEWFEENEMPEISIHHAQAAGDVERVGRIVDDIGRVAYSNGRSDTVFAWLEWLDRRGALDRHPSLAALGALASSVSGDLVGVERWSVRDDAVEPVALMARALQARSGLAVMIEDAQRARALLPDGSGWSAGALLIEGLGRLWDDDIEAADALFAEAVSLSEPLMATATATTALAERALISIEAGDWARAGDHVAAALRLILDGGLEGYPTSALGFVVASRLARRNNDLDRARSHLAQAASLRPRLNVAIPGLAAQVYIEMAKGYLGLADTAGARLMLREGQDIVLQRPGLGRLPRQLDLIKEELDSAPGRVGPSTLTTAELRLLPMLATHLTFPEIGERLYISRHTVKTQAMSIYRKLGASSRSEAVQTARALGFLGA